MRLLDWLIHALLQLRRRLRRRHDRCHRDLILCMAPLAGLLVGLGFFPPFLFVMRLKNHSDVGKLVLVRGGQASEEIPPEVR